MRRLGLAVVAAVALLWAPQAAHAQLFGGECVTADGPCTGLVDQLVQIAKQIEQLVQETITATQEVLNTTPLAGALFQDASGLVQQLVDTASQADLLQGNTGTFVGDINAPVYPLPPDGMQQTILHQNGVGNAIQQLGTVIDSVNPTLAQRAAVFASLTNEALAAIGRMQNQQDTHEVLAMTGQDVHAQTVLMTAMAQGQHASLLADHDRRAMANQWGHLAATSYTPYPMTGQAF